MPLSSPQATSSGAGADLPPELLPSALGEEGRASLSAYLDLLIAWNKALNLSAFHDRETIMRELIGDSFHLAALLESLFPQQAAPFTADLGAGAGLPGIPLRLLWQAGDYVMIEAREKRALFLANALARLKLPGARVFRGRAEAFFASEARQRPLDCVVSRAVMPWPKLGRFCRPSLAEHGLLIVMANQKAPEALDGWRLIEDRPSPAAGKTRHLWALRKSDGAGHER